MHTDLKNIEVGDFFARFSQKVLTDLKTNFTKFDLATTFRSQDMTVLIST